MLRAVALAVFFLSVPATLCHALVLGQEGNVYEIEEIDIAVLLQAKAANFDFANYAEENKRQLADRVKTFRPADAVGDLPVAIRSGSYKIDPSYTLPYDLRDAQGEIVYPQGYTYNPLEVMARQGLSLRMPYVIVNAERREEMLWLEKKLSKSGKGAFKVLITNGFAFELSEKLGFPVYYLSEQVKERLAVKVTPTIIYQPNNEKKFLVANVYRLSSDGREIIPKKR
jgi:conjugal transfer pilus assembly protein TraW